MSITTSVDNDKQLTIHTVTGEASFEEGITTLKQFYEDRPTMNTLWDFARRIWYVCLLKKQKQ